MADLISPRLYQMLSTFYPSVCDIQQATEVRDAYGQPIKTWANLAGHTELACRVSPSGGGERKAPQQVYAVATHIVSLAGNYPAITAEMRAVIDGVNYDILLPRSDGSAASTSLVCQVVT